MANKIQIRLQKISYALIILMALFIKSNFVHAVELVNVRYWAAPDHTRVVIDLDSEPTYEIQESEKFLHLIFKAASIRRPLPGIIEINKPGVKKLILRKESDGSVRVEFILNKHLKTQVFKLKKFQDKPDRLVADIYLDQLSPQEAIKEPAVTGKRQKIIVIDPGHGGDDPGAVGKKGTYEKDIVLFIGREIKKAINKMPGYRAVMTREGDYYVSFNKRLQVAKDLNADLFISVHADAARNRNAQGSSVYCLSTGAASNEAAKLLAKNENLSDIIGGVPNGEGKSDSDQIILNMFQTNTINLSKTFAGSLMHKMAEVNVLKYRTIQEAPFRVLKLPDIPAVLIEVAYISNLHEERLLRNKNFRKKMAHAVAFSVKEYLSGTASIAQSSDASMENDKRNKTNEKKGAVKFKKENEVGTSYYQVKRGDTLFSIARLFHTEVAVLLGLNNMKMEDPLFVGRKIIVPANDSVSAMVAEGNNSDETDKLPDCRKEVRIYKVKKGDTLFSLAKQNSTTIYQLRNLNRMKNGDHLICGQKIKLP